MNPEYYRRKHRKLPPHLHKRRGRNVLIGPQTTVGIPESVYARIAYVAAVTSYTPIGPVARWAYALGRSALMARLSAGDRWDREERRGGRGKITSLALPVSYIRGWPPELECSHGAATRRALDIGLALLEFECQIRGGVVLIDETAYDIIAAEHHPDRYCAPEPWTRPKREPTVERFRSGKTWLG